MARSNIFTHGYVVGILVVSQGDSDDEGRLPDVVASTNKPTFTRLKDQSKLPLPSPEAGAGGAFVSHERITTAVIQSGEHVGQLTSDVDASGAAEPTATPGVHLVVGAYKVDLGRGYPAPFDIEVTADHTQENPLDLYSAAPYTPPAATTVQTVLLPGGAALGDVFRWGTNGPEWSATGGAGTSDHRQLTNRNAADQHTIAAITGLQSALNGKQAAGDYLTATDLPDAPTWATLSGKPTVIAAGTSQTAARNAIGAGTSNLQLGTGSTTAAAGDHTHSQYATTTALTTGLAGKVAGVGIATVRALTQAQYDALTPDPATLYVITD